MFTPPTSTWTPQTILRRTSDGVSAEMKKDPLDVRIEKARRDVAVDTITVLEHGDHVGQQYLQEVGDEVVITISRVQLDGGEEMFRAQFYVPADA